VIVIPGPSEARNPESILTAVWMMSRIVENLTFRDYGFRVRACGAPRNDA
jgi:hypothetical protein